jgi:integrase
MAKLIDRLNAASIEAATEPKYYPDGNGLYLQVTEHGAKSWVFRYQHRGKPHEMGLGSLNAFSLADARKRARAARQLLADGVDPLAAKWAREAQALAERAKTATFKQEAKVFIKANAKGWRNDKHGKQWESTLEAYVYPIIGDIPVQDIDTGMVTKILDPIWSTKSETASRVRGRIERVLDSAKAHGRRTGENPAKWRGHLDMIYPARRRIAPIKNHPALPYAEVPDFLKMLHQQPGLAAVALELLVLTASRTKPIILAEPHEFDLKGAVWTIPASKMKGNRAHRVPLSGRAIVLIRRLDLKPGHQWLFPGRDGQPLSNNSLLALLKRMKRTDITAHGMRASFRTWASEQTTFPEDVIEAALAHAVSDDVVTAYKRTDLFAKRAKLMEAWSDFALPAKVGAIEKAA